jgi:hypothetical protein
MRQDQNINVEAKTVVWENIRLFIQCILEAQRGDILRTDFFITWKNTKVSSSVQLAFALMVNEQDMGNWELSMLHSSVANSASTMVAACSISSKPVDKVPADRSQTQLKTQN